MCATRKQNDTDVAGSRQTMPNLFELRARTSKRHYSRISHARQLCDIPLPCRQVVGIESAELIVPAGACEDLHEVDGGFEEIRQLPC